MPMNFISVMAITEAVARERAVFETGYEANTIGPVVLVVDEENNSRQKAHIFQTANDVTTHALFTNTRLSDVAESIAADLDGPVLVFGPEVTVGG